MPYIVRDKGTGSDRDSGLEAVNMAVTKGELEVVSRACELEDISDVLIKKIPSFNVSSDLIAYASPDSTYAVTKHLLDSAKKSVLIGIYDFTASYMRDILLNLMARGVKVSLMLDLDGVKGEQEVFDKLGSLGAEVVPAPSCASDRISYFASSHEKVIVIDGTWVMVQSGNYSNNSIPLNEKDGGDPQKFVKGNRDMGIAVRSPALAKFFSKVLRKDMSLELSAPEAVAKMPVELPMLVEAAPKLIPKKLFKSKKFSTSKPIKVLPVLSPDNYMDVVPDFLRSARESIIIEQQYIKSSQKEVSKLLGAIKDVMSENNVDVKIILGKIFSNKDIPKEKKNLENLRSKYGLKLGTNVRYIDTKRFVHCHNKLIVIDEKKALVSSQNWSDSAVSKNREAGLILEHSGIAKYYAAIFSSDWETALKKLPAVGGEPESLAASRVKKGGFIEVNYGDYAEV